jgi:hypothetical protein
MTRDLIVRVLPSVLCHKRITCSRWQQCQGAVEQLGKLGALQVPLQIVRIREPKRIQITLRIPINIDHACPLTLLGA